VRWDIVVGCTKKQFQTPNLLEVNSKPKSLKNKYFSNCNVSKCLHGSRDIKRETRLFNFSMSFEIFVSFQKKIETLCLSNFIHK
jgi:hypothetical protein